MSALSDEFYDLLKGLIRVPSVVGAEHSFFTALSRELHERGARVSWYDGLLVAQGSDPGSAMFSAHADRHGLICTGPNEFQFAAFVAGRRSDLLGNSVNEKLITKVVNRYDSARVIAYEPRSGTYLGSGAVTGAFLCDRRKNLIFEISGLDHLMPGTPVAFMDRLILRDDKVSGQLDNVLSVAHLVHLFDLGFRGTLLFAAQEESGSSWRYLMEWFRRFRVAGNVIVVDTSPFDDWPGDFPDVVLRHRDANAVFCEGITRKVEAICKNHGAHYVFKDRYIEDLNETRRKNGEEPQTLGSTELGRLVAASNHEIQGTTLQIPTIGYHTLNETATVRSIEAFSAVLQSLSGIG